MSALAAFRLGPHNGPTFEPYGVLSYDRRQHRYILAEFTDRPAAEAARVRIAKRADAFALLYRQADGEWTVDTPGGAR